MKKPTFDDIIPPGDTIAGVPFGKEMTPYGRAINEFWPEYFQWLVKQQEAQSCNKAPADLIGTPGGTRKGSRRQDDLTRRPRLSEARD